MRNGPEISHGSASSRVVATDDGDESDGVRHIRNGSQIRQILSILNLGMTDTQHFQRHQTTPPCQCHDTPQHYCDTPHQSWTILAPHHTFTHFITLHYTIIKLLGHHEASHYHHSQFLHTTALNTTPHCTLLQHISPTIPQYTSSHHTTPQHRS